MKKIKQLLILVSFMLIGTGSVNALQNIDRFNNLTIAEAGRFYNNTSDTSSTSVGYLTDMMNNSNGLEWYFAQTTSDLTTIYNGYGASISQCGLSFVANNYYSMSFYFLSDATYPLLYSPTYTKKSNKIGISNALSSNVSFNYIETENGENVYSSDYQHVSYYTIIFEAPTTGTCITSAFSTDTDHTFYTDYNMMAYLGYNFEHLGSAPLTEEDIQNALSSEFSSVNNNIDELKEQQSTTNDKLDEANETSKGIWESIKDGFSAIGDWFVSVIEAINEHFLAVGEWFNNLTENLRQWFIDLFNDIKSLFVGEEVTVCETYTNYFTGFTKNISMITSGISTISKLPDENGWITFNPGYKAAFLVEYIENLKPNTEYTVFVEAQEGSTLNSNFIIGYEYNNKYTTYLGKLSVSPTGNLFYHTFTTPEDLSSADYVLDVAYDNTELTEALTVRFMITESGYSDYDYEYFTGIKDMCSSEGSTDGLFGIITGGIESIGNWFQELLDGILEGLKTLFIPEDDYFTNYFDELYNFFVEKLGVLLFPVDLLLDVLDRFINMSDDSSGLIHIPSISVGEFGELIPETDFYINEYWSEEPYSTIYDVYLIFVHAMIGFCLYKLASRKYREIVGSGNSDS